MLVFVWDIFFCLLFFETNSVFVALVVLQLCMQTIAQDIFSVCVQLWLYQYVGHTL